ncbi:MAG: Eco57I restriction-modification methylase domain-containing protein [Terriglobia bacterium]
MPTPAFEDAFEKVSKLAARFQANEARYLSPDYQEAEARKDFIDKLFIALGWDVNHDVQTNPYEQEVKVEPTVQAGGQRRADYAFHLAPNYRDVRFFVEAKKPYGDIASAENYFQTIRYGWNSETPLAVLTDFREFHVLDCRYKPDLDTAMHRNVAKYHYSEYSNREKFAEIYWLFSHEAVADHSLEKRAAELPKPRGKAVQHGLFPGGYQSIDESFLKEFDEHRATLARAFKISKPGLDSEALTELTQRTLDRLVFLRFLEDKAIEPQRIVDRFGERGTAWEDFIAASRRLDGIYNGIVFKHHGILDSDKFHVDDTAFADICKNLAHINSPYDFNYIPIHILGSIYERFLGNVIVATDKRVRVEPKPEVRKAGGVYYTPEYIVRYIVENAVGKLIAARTPDQIAQMRFADIACGSGSFLLGVFDLLLTYHGQYYNDNPRKAREGDCINRDGKLYLSLRKKREILLNNIYGVDIDAQAVEVCQLSLYLKLLQEETEASTQQYLLDFVHVARMKKLLPDLSKNIVCGNSLIGRDINGDLFGEERKLNPMDFEDAFPEVAKCGFDVVVGNPPWGAGFNQLEKNYLRDNYAPVHVRTPESFNYFVYRMWQYTKERGVVGTIIPSSFLNQYEFWKTRKLLVNSARVCRVCNLGDGVFQRVTAPTCILIFSGKERRERAVYLDLRLTERDELPTALPQECGGQEASEIGRDSESFILQLRAGVEVIKKCSRWPKLEEVAEDVATGISSGLDTAYVYGREAAKKLKLENELLRKLVIGGEIHRYLMSPTSGKQIIYVTPETKIESFPHSRAALLPYKDQLKKRREAANGKIPWYSLNWPRRKKLFDKPKVLIRQTSERILAAYDADQWYCLKSAIIVQLKDETRGSYKYFLALLNSRLIDFLYDDLVGEQARVFPEVKPVQLLKLPVHTINFSDAADKARHDEIVQKVDAMLEAKGQLAKAKTDRDKTYYENKCGALDRQIDSLVYDRYGLTEEEVQIVEQQRST